MDLNPETEVKLAHEWLDQHQVMRDVYGFRLSLVGRIAALNHTLSVHRTSEIERQNCDLQEANNKLLLRARAAEDELRALKAGVKEYA